ncbi:MAG: hypothetical protein WAL98_16740 [Desulfatiglandaceae bacterium]
MIWHPEDKGEDKVAVGVRELPEEEAAWAEAGDSAREETVFVPIVGKRCPTRGESPVLSTSAPNAAPR